MKCTVSVIQIRVIDSHKNYSSHLTEIRNYRKKGPQGLTTSIRAPFTELCVMSQLANVSLCSCLSLLYDYLLPNSMIKMKQIKVSN
jgi:hypothetical protein